MITDTLLDSNWQAKHCHIVFSRRPAHIFVSQLIPLSIVIELQFSMQNENSVVDLEKQAANHAPHSPCKVCQQRPTTYKVPFFVTLALLILSCGYILGYITANTTASMPSNSQTANQTKKTYVTIRSEGEIVVEQSPNLKAAETKTEKTEVHPVVPAAVVSPVVGPVSPEASKVAPTASLGQVAKDDKKSKLYGFPLSEKSNLTVVFLTCCGRHYMLEEVLLAFLELNEYPFRKLIVVNDGPSNREANAISEKFPNLTMISTGDKGGQLRAIDEALKLVDTPYVYYNEDDFKLVHSGLITLNIQELEKDPKILQMWNGWHDQNFLTGTRIVDQNWIWGGFSLQPSVWRTSDYRSIQGGFANLTKDASRGIGAGEQEITIIKAFKSQGLYVKQTEIQYIQHLGKDKGLPKKWNP